MKIRICVEKKFDSSVDQIIGNVKGRIVATSFVISSENILKKMKALVS